MPTPEPQKMDNSQKFQAMDAKANPNAGKWYAAQRAYERSFIK
jgi:hypothetical protein